MPIDGGLRDKLEPGMILVATYKGKGAQHRAEIVQDADGKPRYRLADGREFKSTSSAGSAVMGGIVCNGWRFWSIEDPSEAPTAAASEATEEPSGVAAVRKPRKRHSGKAGQ